MKLFLYVFLFILTSSCVSTNSSPENVVNEHEKTTPKLLNNKDQSKIKNIQKDTKKIKFDKFIKDEKNNIKILKDRLKKYRQSADAISIKLKGRLNKNDFNNVSNLIEELNLNDLKQGEFEKSLDFKERKNQRENKLKSKIFSINVYASDYEPQGFIYNADSEKWSLKIGEISSSYGSILDKVKKENYRVSLNNKRENYTSTKANAFGVSVEVESTHMYFNQLLTTDADMINYLNNTWFYIPMSIANAKKLKNNLRHKIVYQINDSPKVIKEVSGQSATLSSPFSTYYEKKLLDINILGVGIYSKNKLIKSISRYEKAIKSLDKAIKFREHRLKEISSKTPIPIFPHEPRENCLHNGKVWRMNLEKGLWECNTY